MRLVLALVLAAATASAVHARLDPDRTGRYAVGATTLTIVDTTRARTLVTEVWYPAAKGGRDVTPRRGRFPLVLLAHGFGGSRLNYDYLTTHLASWGFVVAAASIPGLNHDVPGMSPGDPAVDPQLDLAFLRGQLMHASAPADVVGAHVKRRGSIGLVGHSLGTAIALNDGRADTNVAAVVVLAPTGRAYAPGDFPGGRPAILALGGTADTTTRFDDQVAYLFSLLPAPAALVKIEGGTHSGFTDRDTNLSADALRHQQATARRYGLAFLKRYVARDPRFGRFLTAGDARRWASDVILTPRLH